MVVLLVDVINRFDFPRSGPLVRAAERCIAPLTSLAERARRASVPVIYVNDNFGHWRSDFTRIVEESSADESKGREVARAMRPTPQDYFVLKPQQSGFYASVLPTLLDHLGARRVIVAGFATDKCVFFTASDAHMRRYQVTIVSDCTAANTASAKKRALEHLRSALDVEVRTSRAVRFL